MKEHGSEFLLVGWTTVDSEPVALRLAEQCIAAGLAACVQIDAAVQSVYRWEGQLCRDREWRLMVKFLESKSAALSAWIENEHPYDTPEWVVVRPEQVLPKYLAWAQG